MKISYKKDCKHLKFLSKENQVAYKKAILIFFLGDYEKRIEAKVYVNLMELGITSFDFVEYENNVHITITLVNPHFFIQNDGVITEKLQSYLSDMVLNKPVKIIINKSDLWE